MVKRKGGAGMQALKFFEQLLRAHRFVVFEGLCEFVEDIGREAEIRPWIGRVRPHGVNCGEQMLDFKRVAAGHFRSDILRPRNEAREAKKRQFPRSGFDPANRHGGHGERHGG